MSVFNFNSQRRQLVLAGLAGAAMLAIPAACAAGPSASVTSATSEIDGNSKKFREDSAREGRIVYVGPRQNVKMRFGENTSKDKSERDSDARQKCEGRTYYVGPRHNIKRTFKRDCENGE